MVAPDGNEGEGNNEDEKGIKIPLRVNKENPGNEEPAKELGASIVAECKDEYTIICYPNGTCPCTPIEWRQCASSGCPEMGLTSDC